MLSLGIFAGFAYKTLSQHHCHSFLSLQWSKWSRLKWFDVCKLRSTWVTILFGGSRKCLGGPWALILFFGSILIRPLFLDDTIDCEPFSPGTDRDHFCWCFIRSYESIPQHQSICLGYNNACSTELWLSVQAIEYGCEDSKNCWRVKRRHWCR